ncbi:hypothetical protein J6590_108336 [Homalodisca vitripennis]|nr:hypothetical protein J6590_108336 [Homalodisca vitripennis]
MELAHVDLLLKKELIFEINFRGGNASESDTVQNLRKMLRSLLKLNIRANAGNLKGRIEPSTALKEIKVDLEALSVKIGNLSEEKSTGEYLRLVCRHKHLTVRVDVLCELYKWEGASETLISKLKDGLIEIKAKLGKLGVSEEEIVNFETSLLNTSLEEEEFEEMSKPVSQTRNEDILGLSLPQGKHVEGNFAKLPNPLERFLKMFKPTDGLNVSELLNYIEIMLKIKGETSLSDSEIINMSVGYATGPLYNKMLQFKVNASNFSEVHKGLLDYFVPFGHREALKRDLVTRSQKPGEKLSSYILNVKQNAKLLLCDYSETELTELIKLGISSQVRARLVFCTNPKDFADLDNLCIYEQNVAYEEVKVCEERRVCKSDFVQKSNVNSTANSYVNNPMMVKKAIIKCFICNKPGHIARDCLKNIQRAQIPRFEKSAVPKNL